LFRFLNFSYFSLILIRAKIENSGLYKCRGDESDKGVSRGLSREIRVDVRAKSVKASEDFDYYAEESEEEKVEKAEDGEISCDVVEAELLDLRNESYICLDLNNTKEMSHFSVKFVGGTAMLYCHARGEWEGGPNSNF